MRRYQRIGLTGGIGTGKSTVAGFFRDLGAVVLDADAISHALLERDGACYQSVIDHFGYDIVAADGTIDRGALAARVFSDAAEREALNSIVHPAVFSELERRAEAALKENGDTIVIFDVPLLFECHFEERVDATVLVTAPQDLVLERVMRRDNATRSAVLSRIRAQLPQEEKERLADFILPNDSDLETLRRNTAVLYHRLRGSNAARTGDGV